MPNAKDAELSPIKRILVIGPSGSGKSSQMWTLPGRKFLYLFDPNTLSTIQGLDLEYEPFLPELSELDPSLKKFNKEGKSDRFGEPREPTLWNRWTADLNQRGASGFFNDFDWLCIDSLTFLNKACMARQLFINGRYGDIEDLGDYRIVGSKITQVFDSIVSLPLNIYMTGHLDTFQDEKTKKLMVQIRAAGSSRAMLPLIFTDIWATERDENNKGEVIYQIRTRPDPRGFKDIRTSIRGLDEIVDVTIPNFPSDRGGIGAILSKHRKEQPANK